MYQSYILACVKIYEKTIEYYYFFVWNWMSRFMEVGRSLELKLLKKQLHT